MKQKLYPVWNTAAALVVVAAALTASCAGLSKEKPGLTPESRTYASRLFEKAKADRENGDLEGAALAARELVNNYPNFALIDEAIFVAGQIARERGQTAESASFFTALADRFPLSPLRPQAMLYASESYARMEMYPKSAGLLLEVLQSPADSLVRDECTNRLRTMIRTKLTSSDLETLARSYPSSPLNREIALNLARREYALGNFDKTYELLGEYLYQFPEGDVATEARRLLTLAAERRQAPGEPPAGIVKPNTIGIVLPVTGTLSLYGRYFEEGVRMALDEYNRGAGRQITLALADSRGSPVGAVKAVRKLVLEDGAVGILGSVFTVPTITASIEANAWKTPLLSPVVSANDLTEIGPWVFETRVPPEVEVLAVSNLAVTGLMLERYAVVAPSRGPRKALADLFSEEVSRLGGEVVVSVFYEEGATDFREQLEAVWEAAPEAIFIPASDEELLTLIPQVKFYDLQVQLLGLSNWNSEKLLRLYSDELEGALFPLETYHGKDPVTYQRFKSALEEKGVVDVSPLTVAGYFGMRLLTESITRGASDRGEVRAFLDGELKQDADRRKEEARTLSILTVRSGTVREFDLPTGP